GFLHRRGARARPPPPAGRPPRGRGHAGPSPRPARPSLGAVGQPAGRVGVDERLDDRIEVAVEYGVEVVGLVADPVVGDAVLGEVVGAYPLGPVDRADLAAPL